MILHASQAAQLRAETAYAHAPLKLAHGQRVLDVPLEERLQPRNSELVAWVKPLFPVIKQSVRDARAELHISPTPTTQCANPAAAPVESSNGGTT
jgi:hypothetical protein